MTETHDGDMSFESPHAERALLVRLVSLTDPDASILDTVAPDDFANGNMQEVWRAGRELAAANRMVSPRNILSLRDNLPIRRLLKSVEGAVVGDAQVWEATAQVRELAARRRLRGALVASLERLEAADSASEALEQVHAEIARVDAADMPKQQVVDFADAVLRWRERQAGARERSVVPTPWPDLNDRLSGGLQGGRTYIVGGRPGEGKSLVGANAALHAAELGHSALVFSAEMPVHEVTARMIASGAQANYGQITRRQLDQFTHDRIEEYLAERAETLPLRIVDKTNVSVEYIAATCRAVKRRHGLRVVFVDYLQLLRESDSRVARERQVAQMSRALKVLAGELDVAIVIACQLNRASVSGTGQQAGGRAPTLADLRESGSIEQDADVVILLHHRSEGDVDLVVAKNRTGAPGTVVQRWAPYQARIV